ncbi:adenylosuccinate synthetase [Leptospira koniambonensis]|uniref:adenylosuccinate synthetase n=1 Tax=Leptospira koniambonensis TaxID=2484950 RepID=UPI003EBED434
MSFGDCGKGIFTDFLTRRWKADTIVRFNGGAQAGHNVVLPNGQHHTFSQFGAGSFVPKVETILASPVLIHPGALLVEAEFLNRLGINDILNRLFIDPRCRVITPFHQAAGRLRELLREDKAHGTCGVGIGETVQYSLNFPESTLFFEDLNQPSRVLDKLEEIRKNLLSEFSKIEVHKSGIILNEYNVLNNTNIANDWLNIIKIVTRSVTTLTSSRIAEKLHSSSTSLFEGAQGILLDENFGFHPHTTWSSTHANYLNDLSIEWELPEPILHFGILRTYTTRHGNGPLPTQDPNLNFPELHNSNEGWQGKFRCGHPDEILIKYALSCVGKLSGLLVSHLDIFSKGIPIFWNKTYKSEQNRSGSAYLQTKAADPFTVTGITPTKNPDEQNRITQFLEKVKPVYEKKPILDDTEFLNKLRSISKLPICFGSYGNTYKGIREIDNYKS